jgi:antitoxin component YwqK of YwqJK toxin-antitoxin module
VSDYSDKWRGKMKHVVTVWYKNGEVETSWYMDEVFVDIMKRYYEEDGNVLKVEIFKEKEVKDKEEK